MTVRTRFAPSPTGYLHIGGLRTALYCYLLAKKERGEFLLRIEDTDQERLVTGSLENLIETLNWAGLNFDEGPEVGGNFAPYIQSERLAIYKRHVEDLLANGTAYRCFCTKEDLDKLRTKQTELNLPTKYDGRCKALSSKEIEEKIAAKMPFVIRQMIPASRIIEFVDTIRGRVKFQSKDLEDQVLLKSDGFPTYHLANVIDDHLMEITHVIRGEEWLPSTPKHILLYENFGWTPPQFVHLPLILNSDRSKLSKRQNDVATEAYRQKGYLKEAIINFIALLGWSGGDNREIYSLPELVEAFSLDRVQKSGAVFDVDKLDWFNWQWQRRLYFEELQKAAFLLDPNVKINEYKPNHFDFSFTGENYLELFYVERGKILLEKFKHYLSTQILDNFDETKLGRMLFTVEEKALKEPDFLIQHLNFYLTDKIAYQSSLLLNEKMGVDLDLAKRVLTEAISFQEKIDYKTPETIKAGWIKLIENLQLKNGQVLWPCRVALTGEEFSPGVFEIAWTIGIEQTKARLEAALAYLSS